MRHSSSHYWRENFVNCWEFSTEQAPSGLNAIITSKFLNCTLIQNKSISQEISGVKLIITSAWFKSVHKLPSKIKELHHFHRKNRKRWSRKKNNVCKNKMWKSNEIFFTFNTSQTFRKGWKKYFFSSHRKISHFYTY